MGGWKDVLQMSSYRLPTRQASPDKYFLRQLVVELKKKQLSGLVSFLHYSLLNRPQLGWCFSSFLLVEKSFGESGVKVIPSSIHVRSTQYTDPAP